MWSLFVLVRAFNDRLLLTLSYCAEIANDLDAIIIIVFLGVSLSVANQILLVRQIIDAKMTEADEHAVQTEAPPKVSLVSLDPDTVANQLTLVCCYLVISLLCCVYFYNIIHMTGT